MDLSEENYQDLVAHNLTDELYRLKPQIDRSKTIILISAITCACVNDNPFILKYIFETIDLKLDDEDLIRVAIKFSGPKCIELLDNYGVVEEKYIDELVERGHIKYILEDYDLVYMLKIAIYFNRARIIEKFYNKISDKKTLLLILFWAYEHKRMNIFNEIISEIPREMLIDYLSSYDKNYTSLINIIKPSDEEMIAIEASYVLNDIPFKGKTFIKDILTRKANSRELYEMKKALSPYINLSRDFIKHLSRVYENLGIHIFNI